MNLDNKVIVLTGASGGIGQAIATELAIKGACLILIGRNNDNLEELVATLEGGGHKHCSLALDLGKTEDIESLAERCERLPQGIHILINNAGISDFHFLEDCDDDHIRELLEVNLIAPILLSKNLLPLLRKQEQALIVNIGSALGAIGNPGYSIYGASKAALSRFSETLRRELHNSPVDVLHINPRATNTPFNSDAIVDMNKRLGVNTDSPERVARELVQRIEADRFQESTIGWPEKLFVKINSLLPSLVDKSFAKQLPEIEKFAKSSVPDSSTRVENKQSETSSIAIAETLSQ